jgi:antitoxin component of RelBE/YafQ-DinJ toxin-antitoxin module
MPTNQRPILVPRVISVRLDDATGERLLDAAHRRRVTISDTLRLMITAALSTHSPIPVRQRRLVAAHELAAILGELGKIGSNLNQLARAANRYEFVDAQLLRCAMADLAAIKKQVFQITGGGGGA